MDPLRVKWWGPKHLGPSYICELSLHPKFRSPSITPSYKKAGAEEQRTKKKNNDFNGHLVPTDYVCGDKVFPSDYVCGKASNARAKIERDINEYFVFAPISRIFMFEL